MSKTKDDIEIEKIHAQIMHLSAQTVKLTKETKWYEVALFFGVGSAFTLALLAVFKYLFA